MKITHEMVDTFLNGRDPMERIVSIESDYNDSFVSIIYVNEQGKKMVRKEPFFPFVWVKNSACQRMFGGDRRMISSKLREYGIGVKLLRTSSEDSNKEVSERIENGYKYLFKATKKMSFTRFMSFFREAGTPIYGEKKSDGTKSSDREFLAIPPVEQYMIYSGKRMFKGYNGYDELKRLLFDLETTGLNPRVDSIDQIGIRTNKGYERIISVEGEGDERKENELKAICEFVKVLAEQKPDIIAGHNSENFDWEFIIVRCEMLGVSFKEISEKYLGHPIFKKNKEQVLKLGGETEYYKPTISWGHNIIDSLHAVRRAQAIDSNMKSATLKYATKYLNLNKANRVYVPGSQISEIWNVTEEKYAFNNTNGDWYEITEEKPITEGYKKVTGRHIVERYLLDDIWETDKVELTLNEANFLVAKMLPTTFTRACTMGTAGLWKLIMLAWSYENNLAVPAFGKNRRFVGGLSRLLKVGRVSNIVKLDYNSLYPATILTWNIDNLTDIDGIMLHFLDYILTNREKYKELKAKAGEEADKLKEELETCSKDKLNEIKELISVKKAEKSSNDKKQLPLKIFANSFFGSEGSPSVFPWGSLDAAEMTTCLGRQQLRLMISHFSTISEKFGLNDSDYNYEPIVGDSFTGDTPLFIKYDESGLIDIKPIEELIGDTKVDALGREYDTSEKPYKVLCRSGWMKPEYIYRHKTDKPLYEVSEGNMSVCVTEDHSLFDSDGNKVKPSEIKEDTKLEYYNGEICGDRSLVSINETRARRFAKWLKDGTLDRVAQPMFNTNNKDAIKAFLDEIKEFDLTNASKTCKAGLLYLNKKIKK